MPKSLFFLAVLCTLIVFASTCRGKPNPDPVIDSNFTKVQIHQFGEKYHYFNEQLNQNYYLIRLWGSSYQAGIAYGSMMKKEIRSLLNDLWSYYYTIAEEEFKFILKLPPALQPLGRAFAIKLYKNLLLANSYVTKKYTPKRFHDEIAGISDGSGIPQKWIIQINMIPEYTRAGCSILGAWGKATQGGDLIHLRALDWDVHNPMNKYPIFVVYNLTEKGSHPFVNLAWAGFVGSLTGFGEYTGIGQKVRKQNPVKQNETRLGKPWTYALRDLLQFTETIDQALDNLNKTPRTCSIYVGISNIKSNTFRLIEYSHKEFKVYDDKNFPYTATHRQLDGIVMMPVHDDSGDPCFDDLIHANYGKINGQWITNVLAASHKTGDTQMATFNFVTKELYFQVSNSTKLTFQRSAIRVQLAKYFKF